jgi:hypothetical protein
MVTVPRRGRFLITNVAKPFPFFIPSFVNMSLPNNDFCVASFLYCIQKLEKINWINMVLSTNSPLFAKSSN